MRKLKRMMRLARTAALAACAACLMPHAAAKAYTYSCTYTEASGSVYLESPELSAELEEDFSNWTKRIMIENTGDYDIYARVKGISAYDLEYSDDSGNWTQGSDGWWYYEEVLSAGEMAEGLFILVTPPSEAMDFNVAVIAEYTPVMFDDDGKPYAKW